MIRSSHVQSAGQYDPARVIDTVDLDYEDRRRRRATFTGRKGTEFHVDLAEAPTLMPGDAFELASGDLVAIEGRPERLVEFRSTDAAVITRVAWHLGNRHTPTQLLPNALRIRDDYVLVEMVKRFGAEVAFVEAAFQPEGGAYGHGTVTGHDHHDHDHPHDHGQPHQHDHATAEAEEARLMAETIARREARKAARAASADDIQGMGGQLAGHWPTNSGSR